MGLVRFFVSFPPPFCLSVSLPPIPRLFDFLQFMDHMQLQLNCQRKGERRDLGIDWRNLPGSVLVNASVVPSGPRPNQPNRTDCIHSEIDLRTVEASRVLRFRRCAAGSREYRTLLDGDFISEEEFEVWKKRSGAVYTVAALPKNH